MMKAMQASMKKQNKLDQHEVYVGNTSDDDVLHSYGDKLNFEYRYLVNHETGKHTVDSYFVAAADVNTR
jgi:hypothetical protein